MKKTPPLFIPLIASLALWVIGGYFHAAKPADGFRHTENPRAWRDFHAAVSALQDKGDRPLASAWFTRAAVAFGDAPQAIESRELGALLETMVDEDRAWVEPPDYRALPSEARISYLVHRLRDVQCYQWSQPGMCDVLDAQGNAPGKFNAAIELKALGEPAIPALIALLEDRRPIRSVGYWRDFVPDRTVLRYQDAAIQILARLLPSPFYNRSGSASYFSDESPELRQTVIRAINTWWDQSRGLNEKDRAWLAVDASPVLYDKLGLIGRMATDYPDEKARAVAKLHELRAQRPPLQLPQISLLLCTLGDESLLPVVAEAYRSEVYNVGTPLPDDAAAGTNAQEAALEQLVLYGGARTLNELHLLCYGKPIGSAEKSRPLSVAIDFARNEWRSIPPSYDRSRFPLPLLIEALGRKEESSRVYGSDRSWTRRTGDEAASAIQTFTGIGFGFEESADEAAKDAAIRKIETWWRTRETAN